MCGGALGNFRGGAFGSLGTFGGFTTPLCHEQAPCPDAPENVPSPHREPPPAGTLDTTGGAESGSGVYRGL